MMKNLLLLPEQLFLKSPNLIKIAIIFDSDAQPLARAGKLAQSKDSNLLRVGGYAILTLSTVREDLSWQEQQISISCAEGTVIVLKIQQFYLFLLAFPNLDEQLHLLLKQIENFVKTSHQVNERREANLPIYLTTTEGSRRLSSEAGKEGRMQKGVDRQKGIEDKAKKIIWEGNIFLTRCERELSRSLDQRVARFLIEKHYSIARQNRSVFLEILSQKIRDPLEQKSFLEIMQPFG